jgi:hypothetical protein
MLHLGARAFAFRAWLTSGIRYLRSAGSPNSFLGSDFSFAVVCFAIVLSFRDSQVRNIPNSNSCVRIPVIQLLGSPHAEGAGRAAARSFFFLIGGFNLLQRIGRCNPGRDQAFMALGVDRFHAENDLVNAETG